MATIELASDGEKIQELPQGDRGGRDKRTMRALRRNEGIRDDDIPVRNPSVEAYCVGEEAVLYDSERDQVYAVTALAREMWDRCDGNISLVEIGREITSHIEGSLEQEVPLEQTVDRLRQVASDLMSQDLLFVPSSGLEGEEEPMVLKIVFGDHQVKVRTDDLKFVRAVGRLFRGMLGGDSDRRVLDVFNAKVSGGQYSVQGTRSHHAEEGSLETATRSLKHKIVRRFMEARTDLIWLHAGAAVWEGTSVLVAGEWGSGKSTVIADLCSSGWKYLADDVVPYNPDSGEIMPFPTTIAYRQTTEGQISEQELAGVSKQYVSLDSERVQNSPVEVQVVCFPTFEPGRPAELKEQATAETGVSLVENCQNAGRYRGQAVRQLCQMADRASVFQLRYNNQSDISSLLMSVGR